MSWMVHRSHNQSGKWEGMSAGVKRRRGRRIKREKWETSPKPAKKKIFFSYVDIAKGSSQTSLVPCQIKVLKKLAITWATSQSENDLKECLRKETLEDTLTLTNGALGTWMNAK